MISSSLIFASAAPFGTVPSIVSGREILHRGRLAAGETARAQRFIRRGENFLRIEPFPPRIQRTHAPPDRSRRLAAQLLISDRLRQRVERPHEHRRSRLEWPRPLDQRRQPRIARGELLDAELRIE
jgi:hypothetical protein